MGQEGSKLDSGEQEQEHNSVHAQPSAVAPSVASQKSSGGGSSKTQWMRPSQYRAARLAEARRRAAALGSKRVATSGGSSSSSPSTEEAAVFPTTQMEADQEFTQRLEKSKKELIKKLAVQIKSVQSRWVYVFANKAFAAVMYLHANMGSTLSM